ncbi:MAG: hypothetical protein STSR0009_15870 [Methanoregula sp.]
MHELVRVWTDKKGLTWIAATAIFYALMLIPFNQIHWDIAGISLRPAAALPVVCGILWGPAAAWGLGIGNVAGDAYGSWSPMSIFGFLINFLYPYLSYRLWHRLMRDARVRMDPRCLACFWAVTFISTLVCMFLLAACGTIFFNRPFESKFVSYFGNNILWAMIVGPILFRMIFNLAVQNGLVYGDKWSMRRSLATL